MVAKLSTICQTQFCSCEKSVTEQPYMDPYARRESFPPITLVQSTSHKIHSLTQSHLSSDKTNKPGKQNKQSEHEDFSLAQFIRFLKQIKLKKLLSRINDRRQRNKIEYPSEVILQWSLSVFFFRRGSINAFHTALIKLKPQQRTVILNYLGLKENSLPDRTVVNDYLALVSPDEINELLLMLFDWAKKNKIFYNHAGSLLPNNRFHLACDGVWVHKYAAPHAVNEKGENICPYCLPRVCNRGQPNEKTYWVHGFVNLAMIFPGGLQLPLYVHALKASQIQLEATASDEKLKQESELQALKCILPALKTRLGRIPVTILADSLYANEPIIQLCEQLNWEYIIVRQVGSLKKVASKCDELEKTELYQTSYQSSEMVRLKNGGLVWRVAKWFNNVDIGCESNTNVLRFDLGLGIFCFFVCERKAKIKGILGHY
jgi:hypothetical protein